MVDKPAAIRHSDRLSLSEVVAVAVPRTLGKTEGLAAAAAVAVAELMPVGAAQRGKASAEDLRRHLVLGAGQAEAAQRQRVRATRLAPTGALAVVEQVRVSPARLLAMPVAVAAVAV